MKVHSSSKVVAKHTKESHQVWLDTPGRDGRAHKDNNPRKFIDLEEKYRDKWDILGQNSD